MTSSAAAPLYAPVDINLDASTSKGAGGTGISSYAWSLDGTPVSSAPAYDHVYWDAGTHTVKCTATDVNGHQYSATSTLNITAPPILVTGYNAGQRSATFSTVPNSLLKSTGGYTWNWGDGSPQTVRDTTDPISHTFLDSQQYTVTLTRHTRGNTNVVSTATVDYTPHPTNIYGGTLSGDQEWDASGNPYVIHGILTIPADVTLTLGPGVVLQFTFNSALTILGDLRGPSSGAPAILTSPADASPYGGTDQAGSQDWPGVVYGAGLTANLQNITIKHARNGLSADSANLTRCILTQNSTGVSVSKGGGIYRNCTFTQNGMAVQNSSTVDVDARGNWWGDPSGPYNAKNNPNGKGNQVSDHVIVDGFLLGVPSLSGLTHVLWTNTNGTASLWNYNLTGGTFTQNTYGPYPGWSAKAVADGGTDGKTRLLWNYTSGIASLWSLDNSAGTYTHHEFGPYVGWTAKTVSVAPDNITHLLWANTDGTAALWNYSTDTGGFTLNTYGPYPGWSAGAVSDGPDGKTRLLWTNTDGTMSLWSLNNTTGGFTHHEFGPYPGWAAKTVSVAPDNTTHIVWNKTDGTASVWNYSTATGGFTLNTYGPYPGWSAGPVADTSAGKTALLWTNTNGTASLWNLNNASGVFSQYSFGPYDGWSAVGVSAAP